MPLGDEMWTRLTTSFSADDVCVIFDLGHLVVIIYKMSERCIAKFNVLITAAHDIWIYQRAMYIINSKNELCVLFTSNFCMQIIDNKHSPYIIRNSIALLNQLFWNTAAAD